MLCLFDLVYHVNVVQILELSPNLLHKKKCQYGIESF